MPTFPSTPGYIFPSAKEREADADADADADTESQYTNVEHEREAYVASDPTFPNIVILKQTEHNYIVKHNHYPVQTTVSGESTDDLVSPNQIHKGQISKKRGRKPKAGLILNSKNGLYDATEVPNIILHLKCHVSDLKTNESISNYDYVPSVNEVESYTTHSLYLPSSDINVKKMCDTDDSDGDGDGDDVNLIRMASSSGTVSGAATVSSTSGTAALVSGTMTDSVSLTTPATMPIGPNGSTHNGGSSAHACVGMTMSVIESAPIQILNERTQREIMKKIQRLKYSFHNSETIQTKMNHKSACFWDTCEFDGPVYYIPIMIVNGVFQVNGCYCSPQCAMAALLKEPLDTSTKFERLHLLHLLYGATNGNGNGNGKGFKPAPNPHYLLDKYYGNLTIQEYRTLSKGSSMIHIVNKPLTHILPELYEDNNDFMVNSKVIPTNTLKMKKKYKTLVVQSGAE